MKFHFALLMIFIINNIQKGACGAGSVDSGHIVNIDCGADNIRIIFGYYICKNNNQASDKTSILASFCDGKTSCSMGVGNHILTDPYPGCLKRFDYVYDCIDNQYDLILDHKDLANGYFSTNLKTTGLENENDPTANTYSIIGNIIGETRTNYLDSDSKYTFKLIYRYSDGTEDILNWKQTSWITEPSIVGADLFDIPAYVYNNFQGLGLSTSVETYIDGDGDGSSEWWHAVGSNINWIPAFNGKSAYSESLYILNPIIPTLDPIRAPTNYPTNYPTKPPSANPTTAPSTSAPTRFPTDNPTYQVCTGLEEVNWDLLNTVGQATISPPDITSIWKPTTLQLDVEIILEYITRSKYTFIDQYDSDRGITYVIDTEPFLSDGRYLSDANNCENRESISFAEKSWSTEYWSYLNQANGLNSISYLEYGPANIWTLDWDIMCKTVTYSKSFSFDELLGCKDKENSKTFTFIEDTEWLNLTGSFYVTLTSPLINQNDALFELDNGQYLTNTIGNHPISISFPKKIASIRDPTVILFDISVFAIQYDEESSKLLIDILSYSAEYIHLINMNIISPSITYVSHIDSITITEDDSYSESKECLFETTFRCYQKFQIEIDLSQCPSTSMDLSTPIILQSEPSCRSDRDCTLFESEFGSAGTTRSLTDSLSYVESCDKEIYIQTFEARIKYFNDIAFTNEVDESHEFSIGSRLYVDVSVDDISAYGVFSIDILNVWICTTVLTNLEISSQLTGEGGCIENYNIDEIYQPFKDGLVYDPDLNGQIYQSLNNQSVRFSLIVPSFQRNKFWLHAIVKLKLQNNSARRIRLLLALSNFEEENSENTVNRLSHYIKDVSIYTIYTTRINDNDNDVTNIGTSFLYYNYISYFVLFYYFVFA